MSSNGKQAADAITANLVSLNEALSTDLATFQNILLACEQEGLIAPSSGKELRDTQTGKSTQTRASQLISSLQTVVKFQPNYLDTFLCILKDKGGIPGTAVAQSIAEKYGLHRLPKYTSTSDAVGSDIVDPLDGTPTLDELTEHVDVSTKWYQVGIQLKLDKLDEIDDENKKVADKVSKMYKQWLGKNPNATRRQLLEVLRRKNIQEITLASKYEKALYDGTITTT